MEFKHENGKIILVTDNQEFDVTEKVMPVVDDYLDYCLDLKYGKPVDNSERT